MNLSEAEVLYLNLQKVESRLRTVIQVVQLLLQLQIVIRSEVY
jgi:hypothetical protein